MDVDGVASNTMDDPWPDFDDTHAAAPAVGSEKPHLLVYGEETDDSDNGTTERRGRKVWITMGLLAAGAALMTALALFAARIDFGRPDAAAATPAPTLTETVTASPPPNTTPPAQPASDSSLLRAAASVSAQHEVNRDDLYLAALRDAGMVVTDPAKAIASGRGMCGFLDQGHTKVDAVRDAMASVGVPGRDGCGAIRRSRRPFLLRAIRELRRLR